MPALSAIDRNREGALAARMEVHDGVWSGGSALAAQAGHCPTLRRLIERENLLPNPTDLSGLLASGHSTRRDCARSLIGGSRMRPSTTCGRAISMKRRARSAEYPETQDGAEGGQRPLQK